MRLKGLRASVKWFMAVTTRPLRLRSAGVVIAMGAALTILVAVAAALLIRDLHTRALANTERHLTSLSTVLADQADRAFQAAELVQLAIIAEIQGAGITTEDAFVEWMSRRSVQETLKTRIAALPQVNAITVVDLRGKLINFSRFWPIPAIDISDRDFFQELMSDPKAARVVSRAVRARGDGSWTIYVARKVWAPDGTLLGLVLGAMDVSYFESLYGSIAPDADYVISLFRTDGVLEARYPRSDTVGQQFSTVGASLIRASGASDGVIRNRSPIDGLDRLIATHTLSHYPLTLSVGRTVDASLKNWREQAALLGAAALLLDGGTVGMILLTLRQLQSQQKLLQMKAARQAAEERENNERILRSQYARFGIALNSMAQGLCMFDQDDKLIVMNGRFAQMYALPPSLQEAGTPVQAIIDHLMSAGEAAVLSTHADAFFWMTLEHGPSDFRAVELADGRSISISQARIPGGGWVCTHEDVTERKKNEARIAHMALHDALTGLPNRVRLREYMEHLLARLPADKKAAVLCLDLDGFKAVNDTLGHPAGDELLRQVAGRLRNATRDIDLVARFGGDEFMVIQADVAAPDDAALLAERLVAVMHEPFDLLEQQVEIGTSIGVALIEDACTAPDDLLRSADIALYRAKAAGRGTWRFFERDMEAELQRRRTLEADLKRAYADGQFEIHYQPLVKADTRALTGFEALLRWRHPEKGLIAPGDFIPLAEEIGLIRLLGAWVMAKACRDATEWPEEVKVAVNLSPLQFASGSLKRDVEQALACGLSPLRLELEITESILLQDNHATLEVLHQLRALGVRISMDDFGTGYSSLSYLRSFPFDKIKIDQSFVRNLGRDRGNIEIIRAVAGLSKALGMTVLAEGVETPEQLDILRSEGYAELQGYLFSKPVPKQDVAEIIASYTGATERAA